MNDEILKLAQECGIQEWYLGVPHNRSAIQCRHCDELEAFYCAAFNAGIKKSAEHIEKYCHDDMTRPEEAAAIRALEIKP